VLSENLGHAQLLAQDAEAHDSIAARSGPTGKGEALYGDPRGGATLSPTDPTDPIDRNLRRSGRERIAFCHNAVPRILAVREHLPLHRRWTPTTPQPRPHRADP